MNSNNRTVKIALVFLLLIAIIFSLYYFSNKIFKVKKETSLVEMTLPVETQNLIIGVETVKSQKNGGKDTLLIAGWVLKQNGNEKKRDVFMVLKSQKDTLIFKIENADIVRADVTKYFHLNEDINTGFEMRVPISLIKENNYQVGFIIEDKTGKFFAMSPKSIVLDNGSVRLADLKPVQDSRTKSQQISLTLKASNKAVQNNFENVNISGNNLIISGWGFLQGMNSESMKSFILLKIKDKVTIFSVDILIRKDVTDYFKKAKLNLDSSGFAVQIPTDKLEKGQYQVGLYIQKGIYTGMIFSDKFVDIGK